MSRFLPVFTLGPVTAEAAPPPVLIGAAFNSGGDLRRPDLMSLGGIFLADTSCALIFFTTDPFDQSLVTRGEEVPTAIAAGSKGAAPPCPLHLGAVADDALRKLLF